MRTWFIYTNAALLCGWDTQQNLLFFFDFDILHSVCVDPSMSPETCTPPREEAMKLSDIKACLCSWGVQSVEDHFFGDFECLTAHLTVGIRTCRLFVFRREIWVLADDGQFKIVPFFNKDELRFLLIKMGAIQTTQEEPPPRSVCCAFSRCFS